jgi:hypothetical protein
MTCTFPLATHQNTAMKPQQSDDGIGDTFVSVVDRSSFPEAAPALTRFANRANEPGHRASVSGL